MVKQESKVSLPDQQGSMLNSIVQMKVVDFHLSHVKEMLTIFSTHFNIVNQIDH